MEIEAQAMKRLNDLEKLQSEAIKDIIKLTKQLEGIKKAVGDLVVKEIAKTEKIRIKVMEDKRNPTLNGMVNVSRSFVEVLNSKTLKEVKNADELTEAAQTPEGN